jgi:GNAT superfamily N-acetyltransferase
MIQRSARSIESCGRPDRGLCFSLRISFGGNPRMSDRIPVPLTPSLVRLDDAEFETIRGWPFADSYIGRMLHEDIPQRVRDWFCKIWIYRDPENQLAGFGTFHVGMDCSQYAGKVVHSYIPLLAVNPTIESRGYGTAIVRHLIGEAAILAYRSEGLLDVLFLDVYAANTKAITVYQKCGFAILTDEPIPDPQENGKPYVIMARRVFP